MKINNLERKPGIGESVKLLKALTAFEKLLEEVNKHDIPDDIVDDINKEIAMINQSKSIDTLLAKDIRKSRFRILKRLEKQLGLIPKFHYQNIWLALGISVFGIPIGAAIGLSIGNMAFIGTGIALGLAIGVGIGAGLDKKAAREGKQLDLKIMY